MIKVLLLILISTGQKISLNNGTTIDDRVMRVNDSVIVLEKSGSIKRQEVEAIKIVPESSVPKTDFRDTIPLQKIIKDAGAASSKYPSAKGIILFDDDINILNPDGTNIYKRHLIAKVMSSEKRNWGDFSLGFEETRGNVKVLLARTIHPDGSVSYLDFSKIKIVSPAQGMVHFNQYKKLVFNLPDVAVGDIVECAYESQILKPYDARQFEPCTFSGSSEPIVCQKFTVIIPDSLELNIYRRNGASEPKIKVEDGNRIYVWEERDITPMVEEAYMPGYIEVVPGIFCTLFKDWDYWFDKEGGWKKERLEVTPEIKEVVSKTISPAKSRDDSIALIYHWVQQNVRYISIKGGLASGAAGHPAAVTLKAGYGDCTDKANLLSTMLRAISVDAYPVTLYTNGEGRLPYREIPILWGNHEIVEVRDGGRMFWLDPVSESYRYPYFSASDHGILCINSLARSIDSIPVPPPEDNARIYELEAVIDSSGNVILESYKYYTGSVEAGLRSYYKYTKESEYKDKVQELINQESPGAELISYEIGPTEDLTKQFYLKWKYKLKDYPVQVKDLWVIKVPELRTYEFPEAALAERTYDIVYSTSYQVSHDSKITVPDGYIVDWVPPELNIKNKYASYDASYTVTGNTIEFKDKFSRQERVISVKDYKEYKKFLTEVSNYSKQPFIIKRK